MTLQSRKNRFRLPVDVPEPEIPPVVRPTNQFRSMSYNIYIGGGGGGSRLPQGLAAVSRHIARASPDVLSIQEAGAVSTIRPVLENLGFEYFYGLGGNFGLYSASKFPITYSHTLSNYSGPRRPLYIEVSIDGHTVGIINIHLSSGCTGGCHSSDWENIPPAEPQAQRRTIEMYQIMKYLNDRKAENPAIKGFVVQGDYNAIHNEANVLEYLFPITGFTLPAGLSYPLPNRQFPFKQFEFYGGTMTLDTNVAVDGASYTWWPAPLSPNPTPNLTFEMRIDYMAYSDNLELLGSEILNSISDAALPSAGLQKYGTPLVSTDGYVASDHIPVVADLKIN